MEIIWVPALYIAKDGTKYDLTGYYEASNMGDIRSVPHYSKNRYSYFKRRSTTLKQQLRGKYLVVDIGINHIRHKFQVNRLILSSFDPEGYFDGAECNHKDENPLNNVLSNLEWLGKSDNVNYGTANERRRNVETNNKECSVEIVQLNKDYSLISVYPSMMQAARQTGIEVGNICYCCKGRYKTAGGYIWMYKKDWEIKKAV